MTKTYNGWTNYETWAVKLWMDNDGFSFEQEAIDCERDPAELARMLEDFYEESKPDVPGAFADLLNAALSEVNWYEIAESIIEDLPEEEDEEEEEDA